MITTKAMKKILCIFTFAAVCSSAVFAQGHMRTAYFLDAYDFRHQMNPAFASARSYFSLPFLGYTSVGLQSDFGVRTFLYPTGNGQLTTFMSSSVSNAAFLGQLNRNNLIATDMSTSIFSIGAWGKKNGFTTVELNVKANASVNLPKDLFAFMKNPGAAQHYDISGMGARSKAYLELSLGHTQRLNEKISVGGKIKILAGLANARVDFDRMKIDMTENEWRINANGSMHVSAGKMLSVPTYSQTGGAAEGYRPDQIDFSGIAFADGYDFSKPMSLAGGYGAALDLGFSFEVLKGLSVSAAVIDLGFIRWNNSLYAVTDNNAWSFTGFENISFDGDSENSIGKQFRHIGDDLKSLINLYKKDSSAYTEMLATTINAGLQYKMPFWEGMSVGALLTSRIHGAHSWAEGRLSLNFAFGNVLALSGSYAYSNFGSTFGAALNLHCRAFSFYFGTDTIPVRFSAPLLEAGPVKLRMPVNRINLGMNFGFVFNVSKRKDKAFRR